MIQVHCAACEADFEVGDESAGLSEFCPVCGSLNDIPKIEETDSTEESEPTAVPAPQTAPVATLAPAVVGRGVPAPLWWTLVIAGIGAFIVACVFMFSDNWESRHVQTLADAANRGDVLMADEDFTGAAREYRSVLDTVGSRTIESTFILSVIERSRRGEAEAEARLRAAPLAATAPSATQASPAVATTEPQSQDVEALRTFQRDSEALTEFVRARPMLFQDTNGNWRRRQIAVWDITYDQQTDAQPPQIVLQYTCGSSLTGPHADQFDASNDMNFTYDEMPAAIHCQAWCEQISGRWRVVRQQAESESSTPRMKEVFDLVRQAFGGTQN